METLNFSYNWNSKLRCRSFTTIRMRNDKKYHKGAILNVALQNYPKGKAKIIGISFITLDRISEWIARLDTGYSAKECKEMLKTMYKSKPMIDWKKQEFAYMLLSWEGQERMSDLFETITEENES